MAKFEHSWILMIMAAVALAIVTTPLVGVALARANIEAVNKANSDAHSAVVPGGTEIAFSSHGAHTRPVPINKRERPVILLRDRQENS